MNEAMENVVTFKAEANLTRGNEDRLKGLSMELNGVSEAQKTRRATLDYFVNRHMQLTETLMNEAITGFDISFHVNDGTKIAVSYSGSAKRGAELADTAVKDMTVRIAEGLKRMDEYASFFEVVKRAVEAELKLLNG